MTLIELILVMAVLATLFAVSTPALSGFFAGQRLREEGRRFLALTVAGRNDAIAHAVPYVLRIDPRARTYRLEPTVTYQETPGQPMVYRLAEDLRFELDPQ